MTKIESNSIYTQWGRAYELLEIEVTRLTLRGLRTSAYILLSHFMCNKGKIENPNISKLKGKIKRYKAALEKE